MSQPAQIVRCPRCNRMIGASDNRYNLHSSQNDERCSMSKLRIPASTMSDEDFEWRAKIVADLAEHLQDSDPAIVWDYLTALPAHELQLCLVVALAAIPVDQTIGKMFAWVKQLPLAQLLSEVETA